MRPFLERLAEAMLQRHGNRLDNVAVVLPGKRAGLHLRKYLAKAHGGPLWSPEILDVGAFLQQLSGLRQGTTLEMLFSLYAAYRSVHQERSEALGDFLEWAPTTLRDLSEVDAHQLDLGTLYKDLRAYHELEEWSYRLGELSPAQQRTNAEWRSTGTLHEAFHDRMMKTGLATSGFVARRSAVRAQELTEHPWEHVWFAGLNALDPATTATIAHLQNKGMVTLAWDTDAFYLNDPQQEAGRYLHRSIKALGPGVLPPQNAILEQERAIRVVRAPHALAQVAYLAQRLVDMDPVERERVAVVLADEDLLFPFMQRLPADIGPVNVTMGLALNTLPIHALAEAYLDLLSAGGNGGISLHAAQVLFSHPFLSASDAMHALLDHLRAHPGMRMSLERLYDVLEHADATDADDTKHLLEAVNDPTAVDAGFSALFRLARRHAPDEDIVSEQLALAENVRSKLSVLLEDAGAPVMDIHTYRTIRERVLREERISFLGEPLRGLQVMGLLETRSVDHEHLIIVGMNEGVLPHTDTSATWIPFDLRKHHGLPLPADAEAVTAYNLQRAMQHARHVEWTLSAGEGKDPGEPSRFIAQWQHEVIGNSRTVLDMVQVSAPTMLRGNRPLLVEKDAFVQRRLKELCERGLSPSAIGTWSRCPLDFYFKYVLGVREPETQDGRLGSDVLGDAVHNTLQQLFTPHLGKELVPEHFAQAKAEVPRVLTDQLARTVPRETLEHGHHRLRKEMAARAMEDHLEAERVLSRSTSMHLLAIELDVQARLSNGVLLKGRCDRIDLRDGCVTVLDVKTGTVRRDDLRLLGLARECVTAERRYALQLLVYVWAFMKQRPDIHVARAGVIPLQRAARQGPELLYVAGDELIRRENLEQIDSLLVELINEMIDPEQPFVHDPESTYCTCCIPSSMG